MLTRWTYRLFESYQVSSTNPPVRWNHYKALGLMPSASSADIKAAYYRLSKIHHPDRNNGSAASAQKFRDIVSAYEVLSKTDSRRKYDRELIKKFESRNVDYVPRKKGNKRTIKSQSSGKTKSNLKHDHVKFKYKNSRTLTQELLKNQNGELETFIVRAIPFVVACLFSCKKR